MKKLYFIPLVIIVIAGLILGSCGKPAATVTTTTTATATATKTATATATTTTTAVPTGPYGTLRVSMPSFSYEAFDPIIGESFFGWSLYDPILTWDENFEICPGVCSYTISDDGLTWTFTVHEGVTFHNGDPLTSADVMFSVAHWQSPDSKNPWSPYLSYNFDTHYCQNEYTYIYKSVKPELALAIIFTDVRVLPKNYIETNGLEYFREHPIGSGPWKFVSFTSGYSCVMEANTEHWRTVPAYDTLIQYVVPEEATQIAMLKRGEVDIITGITLDRIVELRDEGYRLEPPAYPDGIMMCMPGTWLPEAGPTHDINVRKALAYAIDYQELCDTFFQGFAEPGGRWFTYPGAWGWDDSWQPEVYDLAEAQSLLAAAGYPEAFDDPVIDIYVQIGTGYTPDLMQVLQGYWTAAGIQTEIHMVDAFGYLGLFFFGAVDPAGDNIGAIIPWAFYISWPNNIYHSFNMYVPGGVHSTSNDQHAAELYDRAVSQTDPELMEEYWKEFQTYVHDELFINFGVCLVWTPMVMGPEVGEFGYGAWISIADAYAGIEHAE